MESMHVFGNHDHLVGWHTQPTLCPSTRTAVVFLTPGMLHHVGPMRLHVQIARALSNMGMPSFRFDLSGIGESLAVASAGCSLERAATELKQALDFLEEEHGYDRFVLFGLCSGADDALAASLVEPRVIGLSLLDGCGFRTRAYAIHRLRRKYWPKLWSFRKWRSVGRSKLLGSKQSIANRMPMGEDIREFPDVATCQLQIAALLARNVNFQWIYTGGAIDYYSYAEQFFDMFPLLSPSKSLSIHYFPQIDHLATLRVDRHMLVQSITEWCQRFNSEAQSCQGLPLALPLQTGSPLEFGATIGSAAVG